jgi:UDP-hydrolysing UDP-N-acetyl-D-glucosamine 2-epimerase
MKVCVFSGSRSEYGLLKELLKLLFKDSFFKTDLIVSGSHLSKKYGLSVKEIVDDKIKIKKKFVLDLKMSTAFGICQNFSDINSKINNFFKTNKYDVLILLGDRYESLAVAIAGYINRIPIAHIHGGEKTEDSLDDNYRHAISKFSNFHFVSHPTNKKRLIQLGEYPQSIKVVGGLGANSISKIKLINKKDLEKLLNIKLKYKVIVINFYPEISNINKSINTLKNIFKVISSIKKIHYVFTLPSHDTGNNQFENLIIKFIKNDKDYFFYKNLGQTKFLSLLKISTLLIGNSSSGILEMPSFGKYSINIGDRQKGRIFSKTVIQCSSKEKELKQKINKYLNIKLSTTVNKNIYYKKNTYKEIIKQLKNKNFLRDNKLKKFRDINQ